jgi:carboxypeptidase Q
MRRPFSLSAAALAIAPLLVTRPLQAQGDTSTIRARYAQVAARIVEAATRDSAAWTRLAELTDRFGHRFSGSESLERAIDWMLAAMRADSLDNAHGEPVMVPRWVRGRESAELIEPRRAPLPMLGLGGSVGTARNGITAPVLVVSSFEELERRAAEARGRIVLFDVPFTSYGATVQYRSRGPAAAARAGAVAMLLRSVASNSIRSPHTGSLRYDSLVARIPAAAITVEDAAMLHRMQERGQRVAVRLTMDARNLPDSPSRNVVAELVGRELPDQIVVMGGHIDSWDVGTGAVDDAGGVVAAWEAVRILRHLGVRPRRTIRVVGWTNEENGLRGALAYREAHQAELERHVLAIESDGGLFRPLGFGFTGPDSARAIVSQIAALLSGIGADSIFATGGGADIGPLMQRGVPGMSLSVDGSRYFWYHHSEGDTVEKLDPAEVARCVAAMAVMAYVVADLPEALPRGAPATR